MTYPGRVATAAGAGRPDAVNPTWYRLPADEVLDRLGVDPAGLEDEEVRRRQEEYGLNRLQRQTTVSAWRVLLGQFTSPLIYVLLGALVLTLAIRHFADAAVVGIVLAVNTTVGFVQEHRAQTAVLSLMELVSPKARVRRAGEDQEVDGEQIVPGDIVVLAQGAIVSADARLLEAQGLRVDESALTGESVPAEKQVDPVDEENLSPADQRDMVFMGTAVTSGEGLGVVVATGTSTEVGQISQQVEEAGITRTPLEQRIDRLAKWITAGILAIASLVFGVGLLLGYGVSDMLLLAVALAVSAIPAGLPIVVTVALAIGVKRMAGRNALIRRLPAVDTLGSTTTIISDKTGTLTQNRMTVRAVICGDQRFDVSDGEELDVDRHVALRETLLVGLLCTSASAEGAGDPMEAALLVSGRDAGLDRDELLGRHPVRDKVPFETERRFMATIHDVPAGDGEGPLVLVKGAPERVAQMCDRRRTADGGEEPLDTEAVVRSGERLAGEGLRMLAMAVGRGEAAADTVRGDDPGGLVFVGMQALVDPPRESAVGAVDRCRAAGIRVVMVTGDHAATAAAIGRQVHIVTDDDGDGEVAGDGPPRAPTGQEIAALSDEELDEVLAGTNVLSRMAPGQKLRIVERLKAADEIVAVTGDGVNDAPALRSAHIGAAMGSGTDVAKEASDMVITDDNFASVYAAVEEGRTAFRNIRMATFFLLSTGAAEVLVIIVSLLLDWPLPLLPAQILWLNVVTSGIADVALAFEPGEEALQRRPPRPKREGVLDATLLERLVIVGVWLAVGSLAVFHWERNVQDQDLDVARTSALTTLVLFQLVHVFNCRSQDVSVFRKSLLANKVLLVGVLASLGVHIGVLYLPWTQQVLRVEPLPPGAWVLALGVALTAILVNEAHKLLRGGRVDGRS